MGSVKKSDKGFRSSKPENIINNALFLTRRPLKTKNLKINCFDFQRVK